MQLHDDFGHDHTHTSEADRQAVAQSLWRQETVVLTTAGIDIGSSTSHLLFARITLQRRSQGLSSRFEVTGREVIFSSPIMHTPFLADGTIDDHRLEHFIADACRLGARGRDDEHYRLLCTGRFQA